MITISDLIYELSVKIESIIFAITLLISGIAYGDAPIDMAFTCNIPSAVYEYEVGDTVDFTVTSENIGRAFTYDQGIAGDGIRYAKGPDEISVTVYQIIDGEKVYIYEEFQSDISNDQYIKFNVKKGYESTETHTFVIPEDAPEGDYIISAQQFGDSEAFEGLITVK